MSCGAVSRRGAMEACQQDGMEWLVNNILGNEVALSKPAIRRWMVSHSVEMSRRR